MSGKKYRAIPNIRPKTMIRTTAPSIHISQFIREDIIAQATRWVDTPWHHGADVIGEGVDCAMLLVRVYTDCGLVGPFDPRPYPPDWMLHRSEERFVDIVSRFATLTYHAEPGDIALFKFGRCVSHAGILVGDDMMIHADLRAGRVIRSEIGTYRQRLDAYWSIKT